MQISEGRVDRANGEASLDARAAKQPDYSRARIAILRGWLFHPGFLTYLLLAILAVKFGIFAVDSHPRFLMGDSGSYLYTALTGWIPEDRSFTYGFLIRPFTVLPGSLIPLVIFQTLLGVVSAWIVGYCLRMYFEAPRWLAGVCALLCCIEPLQLFAERSVLTETVSIFLFAVVVGLSLAYLRNGRFGVLILIQIFSVALISIRISYLPLVLADSILLPLLGPKAVSFVSVITARRRDNTAGSNTRVLRPGLIFAAHFVISIIVCQAVLFGYREWNGHLTNRAPAYNYYDGFFLASMWAPIIEPRDFPIADLRGPIFNHLAFNLKDPTLRANQHFSNGGLIQNIVKETSAKFGGDGVTYPNKLAKKTALRAAKRNPLGLLRLFSITAEEYFAPKYFQSTVAIEEGTIWLAGADFIQELRKNFHQDYSPLQSSLVKDWHSMAVPWYQFLLLAPLVFTIVTIATGYRYARQKIYFIVALYGLTLGAIILAEEPSVRYMVPDAWLTFLVFGAAITAMIPKKTNRG